MRPSLTVVIASYNRPDLVLRAVESASPQADEVIVVDDGSSVPYDASAICYGKTNVRYLRHATNQGVQFARNTGLDAAKTDYALVLDDDDFLTSAVSEAISEITKIEFSHFPVFNFARSNGYLQSSYKIASHSDYLEGGISGDFIPIFNCHHPAKLRYPEIANMRVGVEHLLWWQVAHQYGIPSWGNLILAQTGDEASVRLTSPLTFLERAADFADMQSITLDLMKSRGWDVTFPGAMRTRALALLAYALAADNRTLVKKATKELSGPVAWAASLYSVLPTAFHRNALYLLKRVQLRKTHR